MSNKSVGLLGENLAVEWLLKHDYDILSRNFRVKIGEIDIVCRRNSIIVFVEVKTRMTQTYGMPYEAVSMHKLYVIQRVGTLYSLQKNLFNCMMRVDIISILLNHKFEIVEFVHLEDVLQ